MFPRRCPAGLDRRAAVPTLVCHSVTRRSIPAASPLPGRAGSVCGATRAVPALPCVGSLGASVTLLAQEVLEIVHQLRRVERVVTRGVWFGVLRRIIGLL